MAVGYETPELGQTDRGGNYTVWLLFPDGKWYSPKDVSGLPRVIATPEHVAALEGQYKERRVLPRSSKGRKGIYANQ